MSMLATPAIRKSDLLPHPTQPGKYVVRANPWLKPTPQTPYMQVLPDGSVSASGDTGEFQTCAVDGAGNVVFTCNTQYPTGAYAFPLTDL